MAFTRDSFTFLKQLKAHNQRPWFEANKGRYESEIKAPLQDLIADLAGRFAKVSKHIVVDPSPVGGSAMRIYRDIRFSKDKTPYKPYLAASFWHVKGKESSTPGFYLHIQPGKSIFGGGVWQPDGPPLRRIRDAIAENPNRWKAVKSGLLKRRWEMMGDVLKRPPPGYDPDDPLIDDIKRKDFAVFVSLPDREVLSPKFGQTVAAYAKEMTPFMAFLAKAVAVRY